MTSTRFDPARIRKQLLGACGFEWALEYTFDRGRKNHALASVASADLSTAIECLLVGFDEPAKRLLERASEWVQVAIATGERPGVYFRNGTEASWYKTQSLCTWLLHNRQDTATFARFAEFEDRYIAERSIARDKSEIGLILPTYVDGEMYARAIEIFDATPGLSPPRSTTVQGEARMSYVVSRHRLGLQYSRAEFDTIATRFLKRNVDYLFEQGQWERVARWMKIIYWNSADPPISAKEALLKCYDYLPGREPPGT